MKPVRILIADDQAAVRHALRDLLETEPAFELVGAAATGAEALELAAWRQPDVAVIDVKMPGGGPGLARAILRWCPYTRVLALSAYGDQLTVGAMLRAGAAGYLVKGASTREIIDEVRGVADLHPEAVKSQLS